MVLLPGTLCDERAFTPLTRRLQGRAIQVMPTTGANSAPALARLILARAPPVFILIGFSLGGIVALEIAAIAPDRVLGLVLIASTARPLPPGNAAARRADVADARDRGMTAFLLDRLWPRYVGAASQNDMLLQRVVLDMAETMGITALAEQTEVAIGRNDSRPRLAQLPMPLLAICGQEDVICTPEFHQEIADAVSGATLHFVAGAGHFVLLEAPETTAEIIAAWLDRLPPPSSSIRHPTTQTEELT